MISPAGLPEAELVSKGIRVVSLNLKLGITFSFTLSWQKTLE